MLPLGLLLFNLAIIKVVWNDIDEDYFTCFPSSDKDDAKTTKNGNKIKVFILFFFERKKIKEKVNRKVKSYDNTDLRVLF